MAAVPGFIALFVNEQQQEQRRQNELRLTNRQLRDASNPFELPDFRFLKLFRFSKEATQFIIENVVPHLPSERRNTAIPNYMKVMCALHFFGHGSYQLDVGSAVNVVMSQPAVSRCITAVSNVINDRLLNTWIKFPMNNNDMESKAQAFSRRYQFPNTIGVIDGTHIAIIAPPKEHEIYPAAPYYNRKGFYSRNVQIISDANLNIINMNARFPGSTHDSAIWMMSSINRHLRRTYFNDNLKYHLIGDEGYPLTPWLLIKYPGDVNENTPQGRFNTHLTRARLTIERLNGYIYI